MKLWQVQWDEPDGPVEKSPGATAQKLKRVSHIYAAVTAPEVWDAIQDLLRDPEREFISLAAVSPSVTILKRDGSAEDKGASGEG